jgi:hypothetical protein
MASNRGSVRIGPISILTLIIVLSLSVMAVLALTTVRANNAITDRLASTTHEIYANESAAQLFIASLDEELAQAHANNEASFGAGAELDSLAQEAAATASENTTNNTTVSAYTSLDGATLTARFITNNGHALTVVATLENNSLAIESWKTSTEETTTDSNEESGLWQGITKN